MHALAATHDAAVQMIDRALFWKAISPTGAGRVNTTWK
jgi:hypothetical protein